MRIPRLLIAVVFLTGTAQSGLPTAHCDFPLLDGPATFFKYTKSSKELKCNDGKEIRCGADQYEKLTCDEVKGWIDPEDPKEIVFPDPSKKFTFTCEAKKPNCDNSLVRGPKVQYTYISKVLKCKDGKEIKSGTDQYEKLTCDEVKGWINPEDPKEIVFPYPSKKFTFTCEAKKPNCDSSLVHGPKDDYTFVSKGLKCKSGNEIEWGGIRYATLICNEVTGWINPLNNNQEVFRDASKKFRFTCEAPKIKCDESLITGPTDKDGDNDYTFIAKVLKCREDNEAIVLRGHQYATLVCKDETGWINPANNGEKVIDDPSEKIAIECAIKACDKSLIAKLNKKKTYSSTNVLTCNDPKMQLKYRVFQSGESYIKADSITCDGSKWAPSDIAATDKIEVICIKKECDSSLITMNGGEIKEIDKGKIEISCPNAMPLIEVNGQALYEELKCSKANEEWHEHNRNAGLKISTAFKAKCVSKKCHHSLSLLSEGAVRNGNTITCGNKNDELKMSHKNDHHSYHSKLICEEVEGWKDENDNPLDGADEKINVECVEKTCDESLLTIDLSSGVLFRKCRSREKCLHKMECSDQGKVLEISTELYPWLKCVKEDKWNDVKKAIKEQNFAVKCVELACHKSHIDAGEGVVVGQNTLSCRENTHELRLSYIDAATTDISTHNIFGSEFVCDKTEGWTRDSFKMGIRADNAVAFYCEPKSCDKSLILNANLAQFEFNRLDPSKDIFKLKCVNDKEFLIVKGRFDFYEELDCYKAHPYWEYKNTRMEMKTDEPISVNCVRKECHDYMITLDGAVRKSSDAIRILSCPDSQMDIHIDGTTVFAKTLSCDPSVGWKAGKIKTGVSAVTSVKIDCVKEECHKSNVISDPSEVKVFDPNNEIRRMHLKCIKPNEQIHFLDSFHDSIECSKEIGWISNSKDGGVKPLNIISRDKITVECKVGDRCDHKFIIGNKEMYNFEYESKKVRRLTCKNRQHKMRVNQVYFGDELTCNIVNNVWEEIGISGNEILNVECNTICEFELNSGKNDIIKYVDEHTGDIALLCEPHKTEIVHWPRILVLNGEKHTNLNCSLKNGWVNENEIAIASAETTLELQCEKYCMFSHIENEYYPSSSFKENIFTVTANKLCSFNVTGAFVKLPLVDTISCSYQKGWQANGMQINADTSKSLELTSTRMCTVAQGPDLEFNELTGKLKCSNGKTLTLEYEFFAPELQCDPVLGWHDPVFPYITRYHRTRTAVLAASCTENDAACASYQSEEEFGEPVDPPGVLLPAGYTVGVYICENIKHGIKLNDAFVHSQLHCDPGRGWTDFEGNWFAESRADVAITCENIKCTTEHKKTCDDPSTAPLGYECVSHDFDADSDPNLRKCGEYQQLFIAPDKLVMRGLRCSDDGSWHEIGDKYKKVVASGKPTISCVEKHCSKCLALKRLENNEYTTTVPTFVAGSVDGCANTTCPNSLWLVEIGGNSQEYTGDIVCASDKSNWILDEPEISNRRSVDSAVCINKLKNCETGISERPYKDFKRCTVSENGDFCHCSGKGEKLYIKQNAPQNTTFEKVLQIICDRKAGWIAKIKKNDDVEVYSIVKTDIVICDIETPELNLTDSKTTPMPKLTACDLCPHPFKTWLQCDKCSHKVLDIQLANSHNNEKCIATSSVGGKFYSEQYGEINDAIECDKEEKVWKYSGKEIGKVAALQDNNEEKESGSHLVTIVVCCSLGLVIIGILLLLVYKVFISKRNPAENSGDKKSGSCEKNKRNESHDDGLEDVKVDNNM